MSTAGLLAWARRFDERQWAVENAEGLGRPLAQWLLARGEIVLATYAAQAGAHADPSPAP